MRNTVGDAAPQALQEAFVDSAGAALEYFERHTEVKLAVITLPA